MRIMKITPSRDDTQQAIVFLEDGKWLKITEEEVLAFALRPGQELNAEEFQRLTQSAELSQVKSMAAKLLSQKTMSIQELTRKLQAKSISEHMAEQAVQWLIELGMLDDTDYAAQIVRVYGKRGGPAYVRQKLYEHGVPQALWAEALSELPEPSLQIDRYITTKLRGEIPDSKQRQKIAHALAQKGYLWSDIQAGLRRYEESMETEE